MFGKKKNEDGSATTTKESPERLTIIALGTSVTGTITVEGNLRLDGIVEGNISSKGKVVIGPQGKVHGNISCDMAILHGALDGDVHASEGLIMKSGCIMDGDVYTSKLEIESKARFNGACKTTEKNTLVEGKGNLRGQKSKED